MARTPNIFANPKTGQTYRWPVNHETAEPITKSRQMADGAPTSNIGLIPQQGAATPLILQWKGKIFDPAQHDAFIQWWQLCEEQTIYLTDFKGNQYEVLITDFSPQEIACARNPRFPDLRYYYEYTFIFRVVRVISGPWAGVA